MKPLVVEVLEEHDNGEDDETTGDANGELGGFEEIDASFGTEEALKPSTELFSLESWEKKIEGAEHNGNDAQKRKEALFLMEKPNVAENPFLESKKKSSVSEELSSLASRCVTVDLIRKRHLDDTKLLSEIEFLDLHQEHLSSMGPILGKLCGKSLRTLLLHNNVIRHVPLPDTKHLVALEHWSLALNNIHCLHAGTLNRMESLSKLDLTLNFIGLLQLSETMDALSELRSLKELYLVGNPCWYKQSHDATDARQETVAASHSSSSLERNPTSSSWKGYRTYVIGRLPTLQILDGTGITQQERQAACSQLESLEKELQNLQPSTTTTSSEEIQRSARITSCVRPTKGEKRRPLIEELESATAAEPSGPVRDHCTDTKKNTCATHEPNGDYPCPEEQVGSTTRLLPDTSRERNPACTETPTSQTQHTPDERDILNEEALIVQEAKDAQQRTLSANTTANLELYNDLDLNPLKHERKVQETRALERSKEHTKLRNCNDGRWKYSVRQTATHWLVDVDIPKEVPSDMTDVDIQSNFVSIVAASKVWRLVLSGSDSLFGDSQSFVSVLPKDSTVKRSSVSGSVAISMPKVGHTPTTTPANGTGSAMVVCDSKATNIANHEENDDDEKQEYAVLRRKCSVLEEIAGGGPPETLPSSSFYSGTQLPPVTEASTSRRGKAVVAEQVSSPSERFPGATKESLEQDANASALVQELDPYQRERQPRQVVGDAKDDDDLDDETDDDDYDDGPPPLD